MPRLASRALSVLAVFVVSLVASCADLETPTTARPTEALQAAGEAGAPALTYLARYTPARAATEVMRQQWIGPEGGRLEFHGFAIVVPAGAVAERTHFSVRLPADALATERVVAEFGPHGAQFAVPVRIELPLAGTSVAGSPNATVVWWDGTRWVDMGGAPTVDGARVWTTTDHFSLFGTSQAQGGVITASGG